MYICTRLAAEKAWKFSSRFVRCSRMRTVAVCSGRHPHVLYNRSRTQNNAPAEIVRKIRPCSPSPVVIMWLWEKGAGMGGAACLRRNAGPAEGPAPLSDEHFGKHDDREVRKRANLRGRPVLVFRSGKRERLEMPRVRRNGRDRRRVQLLPVRPLPPVRGTPDFHRRDR